MRVMMAGGGTGGHVYPAVAILDELRRADPTVEVVYVGTWRGIESRVLRTRPWVRFLPIHARGRRPGTRFDRLRVAFWLAVGLVETAMALLRFRPHVVVGVGGYSSFPPVLLGALAGFVFPIRTVIHEQNAVAGLANRWLSRFVNLVLISYPTSREQFPRARRVVTTGNPIRDEFLRQERAEAGYRMFGLDPRKRTVLVFGGSNGSSDLTEEVLSGTRELSRRQEVQVLLVTGSEAAAEEARRRLAKDGIVNAVVVPYIEQMAVAFAIADLIVSRAGATTLAEITGCGKPAILVPWRGATDDHQLENARVLEREEACRLASDEIMVRHELVRLVLDVVRDEAALARLGRNAHRMGQRQAGPLIRSEIQGLVRGAGA
ncbi:MAG: undecaprenyldiphospho-muramoylpentapeptide beta-N-acetylglucosaminyltransferase [Candidatus Bipolaricaulota bacterium]|nr:undecaprenyldiphospho-muramoylpentapeptide beta-N-acetylglucosaminyltransferase [Candidatus Bipolaricaulota bacterium]